MRLPSFVVAALLAGVSLIVVDSAAAQTTHVAGDGSAAYTVPAGFTPIKSATGTPDQATFAISRVIGGNTKRVGFCILRLAPMKSRPDRPTWAALVAQNRNNTEQMARARVEASVEFIGLGGYKDVIVGADNGYGFWYQQRRANGQLETRVTFAVVLMPDRLYGGECNSIQGFTFTPAEIDRIFTLAASARRP